MQACSPVALLLMLMICCCARSSGQSLGRAHPIQPQATVDLRPGTPFSYFPSTIQSSIRSHSPVIWSVFLG
uniref:Putative secreted protein n=1 Tax=Anopheles marajoara TaxID=58244 RepID=A0A2M4CE28_9DIPT